MNSLRDEMKDRIVDLLEGEFLSPYMSSGMIREVSADIADIVFSLLEISPLKQDQDFKEGEKYE